MRDYSQDDLDGVAAELNGRPRQTVGFKTPSEAVTEGVCDDRLSPQACSDIVASA